MIRAIKNSDIDEISEVIKDAFSGFPWYQNHSKKYYSQWILGDFKKSGFFGFVAIKDGIIVGVIWCVLFTKEDILLQKKGIELFKLIKDFNQENVVWGKNLIVRQKYQHKGYGCALKKHEISFIKKLPQRFFFTTIRSDNYPSIESAKKSGYKKSGIFFSSSKDSRLFFEYWYFDLNTLL